MHVEDLVAAADVGQRHHHLAVEAARTQQSWVENVGTVRRGDHDHVGAGVEAVHLDEHLVEGLLAFVIAAAEACAALAADRIDFVNEDDAGLVLLGGLEHVAHAGCAHADEHFNEVRTGDREERHARLAGDRLGEERLAGARRSDEQQAARNAAAETLEALGFAKEVHDFLNVFLGLVAARDVAEAHLVAFLVKLAGLRLAEAERSATAARTALHAAHEEDPHADEKDHREPGDEDGRQKRRLLLGLAVDLNVALPELVHHPDVARIGELEFLAGLGRDDERTALDVDATDLARLGVLHELRVADRVARRGVGVFILAEHREEHQTDQRPDGDAAEDFVVQCMSPDGGAAVGPCAVIFLSLVRRPSPRKPFGIGKGVMGIF